MGNQILLVDDDTDLLDSNKILLELEGYEVLTALNGKEGLEVYKNNKPCIVFSDVKMNEMDGYELFSKIRELDPIAKIILFTGHEDKVKSKIAIQNGLLEIISKPISIVNFTDSIKKNNC